MRYINKTAFINYLSCPALGWMTRRNMLPKLTDPSDELLRLEGRKIRNISRQFFSNAVNAGKLGIDDSVLYTKELVLDPGIKTIYGASFVAGGYLAKADIVQRLDGNSWHLFEVKSGSKYKVKYAYDMSFNAMVLTKSGLNVSKATLLCLSNDYRLGMDVSQLFKELDCTEKVEPKVQDFLILSDEVLENIESENMPEPYLKRNCKNCPMFDGCMNKDVRNHIFDLPRLSVLAMEKLIAAGADTISKIPADFELTQMQQIVKNCVLTNTNYISENLKTELENIKQPFYYLDFESVMTIMPLYRNIAPHTQLLTQFSMDKTDDAGNILDHYEYIADQTRDCRLEIAERLIKCLGEEGSIITYANFERIAISNLARLFSDLCEKLNKIAGRIVDLEYIVKKNYYDVNFRGRSSIKKVLPVLIPEMNYTDLEIGAGGDAAASFAFMAMGLYDDKKIEETKKNLLKYCARDTLAMVKIHQFLKTVVS
jgi:CRISPR/Cas system-associated exonuclease Cas4 (RecB family)